MPVFQDLAKEGKLEAHEIDVNMAAKKKYQDSYNATSHRWKAVFHPDMNGEQLAAVQREARKNPKLQWFWIDYPCLPQDIKDKSGKVIQPKTELEARYFAKALSGVNVLDPHSACCRGGSRYVEGCWGLLG